MIKWLPHSCQTEMRLSIAILTDGWSAHSRYLTLFAVSTCRDSAVTQPWVTPSFSSIMLSSANRNPPTEQAHSMRYKLTAVYICTYVYTCKYWWILSRQHMNNIRILFQSPSSRFSQVGTDTGKQRIGKTGTGKTAILKTQVSASSCLLLNRKPIYSLPTTQ